MQTWQRVNGAVLNVREQSAGGDGSAALVFLHYFGGSSLAWQPVAAILQSHHRCVMPDLRGFGDSAVPTTPMTLDQVATDIIELLHTMGIGRHVLVGHSMGAKIALAVAARKPAGLRALVLLAPSPPSPEPMADSARAQLLQRHTDPAAAEQATRLLVGARVSREVFDQIVHDRVRCSAAAWRWWLASASREDIGSRVMSVDLPTLVLSGALDDVIPGALVESEVSRRLLHATTLHLPGCGHLLPLEAPDVVARHIRDWSAAAAATG
ncbi:MAG: alpha/beta hydrolase [Chitinophagaceae bacterium]|nr:alpha/beta hydrolase [Rubrivivax sp.]